MYNYEDAKSNIINILKSNIPIEKCKLIPSDNEFTYKNGIECWVSAIFVDIKNSSELFKRRDAKLANLLRAFTSELITIFQNYNAYNQIGIRGDCVYAIYSTPDEECLDKVLDVAANVNSFMNMFNKLLAVFKYTTIGVGIGLGCDKELIIKAGRTGTGINDKIWIGKAVVDASNLSSIANRYGFKKIAMNSCFHDYLMNLSNYKNRVDWFIRRFNTQYFDEEFYECDIINKGFENWIKGNL